MSRPEMRSGTVLVQDGLLLPPELKIVTESYSPGWQMVMGSGGFAFDHQLRQSGWSSIFLAGELKSVSFGGSSVGMLDGAVRKLLAKVRAQDFNCAELTGVTTSHFLGIPYVSIRGHARQVQQGYQLDSPHKVKPTK